MRADPAEYELVSPDNLREVLSLLASEPAQWLPIAGGTDVMVLYSAGKLPNRKLVNVWNIPELRQVEVLPDRIRIGAVCTYTALRRHEIISREFPLLSTAASWTGGIANQNRGTLGGNIANASPAADSLPALLVYDAELTLISVRGERRVPYRRFHTGYKKTVLAVDELIRDITLPRQFSEYVSHARKVGARKAQAREVAQETQVRRVFPFSRHSIQYSGIPPRSFSMKLASILTPQGPRAALAVPYLWTLGVFTFSAGLFYGGLKGVPRRTNLGMSFLDPPSDGSRPDGVIGERPVGL